MNILTRLTWQNIRRNRRRSIAALSGICLAAAMFTFLTTTVYSLWDYVRRGTEYETGNYFVSCDYVDEAEFETIGNDPMIHEFSDLRVIGHISLFEELGHSSLHPVAAVDQNFFQEMSVPLKEGRLPENSSEILIPSGINYTCLAEGWPTWEIGQTVCLDFFDFREAEYREDEDGRAAAYRPERTWNKEYRIVGITDDKIYSDDPQDWGFSCLMILSDGLEGDTLWHRLFLRTAPKDAAIVKAKGYGQKSYLNDDLLLVYGVGSIGESTGRLFIILFAALLIISVISVVLIRSVFSLSVTERTRDFGLLASIGTTPKQIRTLVRREALFYLAAALPPGLLLGTLGAGALVSGFRIVLASQFTFGDEVVTEVRLFPAALLGAALICTLTVFLSVASPARRASRIIPLEAIRQSRDIRIREMKTKTAKRTSHLLGVPGWVGRQYGRVSRGKSYAVTATLALSLVLFLSTVSLAEQMEKASSSMHSSTTGFDFLLDSAKGRIDEEIVEEIRMEPGVYDSVLYSEEQLMAVFPTADLSEDYKKNRPEEGGDLTIHDYSRRYSVEMVQISYIEDEVFSEALRKEGIDPEPYIRGDALMALLVPHDYRGYMVPDGNGGWTQVSYEGYGIEKTPEELLCLQMVMVSLPDEGAPGGEATGRPGGFAATDDGHFLFENGKSWLMELETEGDRGASTITYRSYEKDTGKIGEPLATADARYIRIHPIEQLQEVPYGSCNPSIITFILPLSKGPEYELVHLGINIRTLSDYYSVLAKLKALNKENPLLIYSDYRESAVNALGMAAMLRGISTGFLILLSLLCAINVFYTMAMNIMLRHRDFGILKSLGFTRKDLLRMVAAESAGSIARALIYGIPLSLIVCYVLSGRPFGNSAAFRIPWEALLLYAGVLLLLMLLSTLYGLWLLRRMTPIEAIREENV